MSWTCKACGISVAIGATYCDPCAMMRDWAKNACPVVGKPEKPEAETLTCCVCGTKFKGIPDGKPDYCGPDCEASEPSILASGPLPVVRLDLGGGEISAREGFISIDRRNGREVFPLAFPDAIAEEIVASHVLEHFSMRDTADVLKEWVRVLKPGGLLRIAVPNLTWILEHPEHPHFEGYLMGGQTDSNDFHHALFTEQKLRTLMAGAGLVDVFPWVSEIEDCASLDVSLNLQGRKPGPAKVIDRKAVKIVGCLSAPRVGFTDTWVCIAAICAQWGIKMLRHRGAYWEQVMQNMLVDACAQDFDFAVTFDYDSTFTAENFNSLFSHMLENPDVDAVAAFQPMRGRAGTALCGLKEAPQGGSAKISMDKPIEAASAHFGLTIFRLSRLKGIPLPWLHSQPGPEGEWRDDKGKVDADIYFWRKFTEHGRKLHVLPWVCIGHMEMMVTMMDKRTGKTITMHAKDWMNNVMGKGV